MYINFKVADSPLTESVEFGGEILSSMLRNKLREASSSEIAQGPARSQRLLLQYSTQSFNNGDQKGLVNFDPSGREGSNKVLPCKHNWIGGAEGNVARIQ